MRFWGTLLFLLGCGFSARAVETGFTAGNSFEAVRLRGEVLVTCNDPGRGSSFGNFVCVRDTLLPAEYSYFRTEPGIDADRVVLTANHGDGSKTKKESKFISETGKSKSSFNLWIRTLTQRPLLRDTKTNIDYTLTKGGRAVAQGVFTTTITRRDDVRCRRGHVYSTNPSDCQFSEFACDEYFYEANRYCR